MPELMKAGKDLRTPISSIPLFLPSLAFFVAWQVGKPTLGGGNRGLLFPGFCYNFDR